MRWQADAGAADAANPFLFAVGCPRSGTTLLQRMLDNHPLLAVTNDSHFVPRALEALAPGSVALGADPPLTPEIVEWVRSYRRTYRLGLSDEAIREAGAQARTYREFVSNVYSAVAAARGKWFAGEKTPDYVRYLDLLHGLFPRAKFVHIVRDGRDVALSTLEWARDGKGPSKRRLWATEPVAVCAQWWSWQVEKGREAGNRLGASVYLEVCYERLVAEPEAVMHEVAAFLGLPFAPEMLAYHEGRRRDDPKLSAKSAWLPPTRGLRNWRTEMSPRDLELFEALAGETLATSGYELVTSAVSPEVRAVADDCSAQWLAETARPAPSSSPRAKQEGA